MKDEYDYIIENILIPEEMDDDYGWYDEYIDYLLDKLLKDIELVKTYRYRKEKLEYLKNRIENK